MEFLPFRPLVFRRDLTGVTSPPIDIVSPEHEASLKSSPYNITHVTIPKHGDVENSVSTLRKWIEHGVLERLPEEGIVILRQDIPVRGVHLSRIGIIAPVRTSPGKEILPHEETFQWAVKERQALLASTRCQLEPIFLTVNGTNFERILKSAVKQAPPLRQFQEQDGIMNTAFFVSDRQTLDSIQSSLAREKAIVADGHHRLHAVRNIFQLDNSDSFWSHSLSYVTSLQSESLLIGGIHRLINPDMKIRDFLGDISSYFEISDLPGDQKQNLITLYDGTYRSLKPKSLAFEAIGCSRRYQYDGDPALVSLLILRQIMGMSQSELSTKVTYTHSRPFARDEVDSGHASFVFLMPEWDKSVFISMIEDGRMLPQKSTYFYPKVPSGIALYCSD